MSRIVIFSVVALLLLAGCSTTVAPEKVYGTYLADYPFGSASLKLEHDGSFVQEVTIKDQEPKTVRGSWNFDRVRSEITLHGALAVADGYGHLSNSWQTTEDLVNQRVERLWFRVVIEISVDYPYVKQ
jgi:hypothetical protein